MTVPSTGESSIVVAISERGDVVVVAGASQSLSGNGTDVGIVRVFRYVDDAWSPIGPGILGVQSTQFGHSVAASSSGTRITVGAPTAGGAGEVRVYEFVAVQGGSGGPDSANADGAGEWVQRGRTIRGAWGLFESSLSLAGDGDRLAVGTPQSRWGRERRNRRVGSSHSRLTVQQTTAQSSGLSLIHI